MPENRGVIKGGLAQKATKHHYENCKNNRAQQETNEEAQSQPKTITVGIMCAGLYLRGFNLLFEEIVSFFYVYHKRIIAY